MQLNEIISVSGFITREISIRGKSLPEIEKILGFHAGRLNIGITVAVLLEIPQSHQFELAGYTQVADHRFDKSKALKGLDERKLKEIAVSSFVTSGVNRLVKVMPATAHSNAMDNEAQYPPGQGVPQWKLRCPLRAQVIAKILPGQRYS